MFLIKKILESLLKFKVVQDDNIFLVSTNKNENIIFKISNLVIQGRASSGRNIARLSRDKWVEGIVRLPNLDSDFINGEKYDGEYQNRKKNGTGSLTFINGEKYVGEFKDDKFNGNGVFTYLRGKKYVGEFKDGKYNGYGVLDLGNRTKYVGEFKDGKYDGYGKLTVGSLSEYIGDFKKGEFDGYGIYTTPGGPNYKGGFKDGKRNGKGIIYFPSGRSFKQEYKNGEFANDLNDRILTITSKESEGQINNSANSSKNYLFFDTETTGFPKNWNAPVTDLDNWPRLVQLAYMLYDSKGNLILSNECIIKPEGFTIPISASNIHRVSTERAFKEGQPITSVLNEFNDLIKKADYLVAHNMSFDEKIIGSELLRNGFKDSTQNKDKICTKLKSTRFCAIKGSYGYKWPKLSELHYKLFGFDFEGSHDALSDVSATAKCFWELRRIGEI